MTLSTADILRKAKARISKRSSWHKGAPFPGYVEGSNARTPDECPCCAYAAIAWAVDCGYDDIPHRFELALGPYIDATDNDHPDTSHRDVMQAFDRAIAKAEAEEAQA